jgi:hypothetical protein
VRIRFSKIPAAIGLAVGLAIIGGSVVGGIALASERSNGASTEDPPGVSQTTDEDQNDETDNATENEQGPDATGEDTDEADEATEDADNDTSTAQPTPSPSRSHDDDDGPGDD